MDYRNADGSLSEMCGNGTRVFAAYLRREGLETADEFAIATRAGVKHVRRDGDGFAVDLGPWRLADPRDRRARRLRRAGAPRRRRRPVLGAARRPRQPAHRRGAARAASTSTTLDLTRAPARAARARSTAPTSSSCGPMGPGHVAMRVHERGVGETRSCGTGACAAAIATSFWAGSLDTGATWLVDVPGGRLTVRLLPDHGVELAGPAVLVADGAVDLALLPR